MEKLSYNPADMGAEFSKFRDKTVSAANAATPLARLALAGLLSGGATENSLTLAAIAAYKNPKTPKGKPVESISGLRYAPGGDAARKTLETVFRLAKDCALSDDIRASVTAFVLEAKGSAKSLAALSDIVKAQVKALNEAQGAQEQANEGEGQASEGEAPARPDIAHMANLLALALEQASDADLDGAIDAIAALASRINALFEADEPAREAA